MLLKLLVLVLIALVAFGGRKRIWGLLQGARQAPSSYREGKARAEDPVPFAKDVTPSRGSTPTPE